MSILDYCYLFWCLFLTILTYFCITFCLRKRVSFYIMIYIIIYKYTVNALVKTGGRPICYRRVKNAETNVKRNTIPVKIDRYSAVSSWLLWTSFFVKWQNREQRERERERERERDNYERSPSFAFPFHATRSLLWVVTYSSSTQVVSTNSLYVTKELLTFQHSQHSNHGCKIIIFLLDRIYSLGCDSMLAVFCWLFYFIIVCTICVVSTECACIMCYCGAAVLVIILVLLH